MKKILTIAVLTIMVGCMLCVRPLDLVRRDREVHSGDTEAYGITYQLTPGMHFQQNFVAEEAVIQKMSFCFDGDINNAPDYLFITVKLKSMKSDKILFEQTLTKEDLLQSMYRNIEEKIRVKAGQEYSLVFDVESKGDTGLVLLTTPSEENFFPGASGLYFERELFPAQLYMSILYAENMNWKNTLFQWSFLWTLAAVLIFIIKNAGGNATGKKNESL